METIKETLKHTQNDSIADVKSQLNTLVNLLKCWDLCINHIKALERVSIINIKTFPKSFFYVITDALSHCKSRYVENLNE